MVVVAGLAPAVFTSWVPDLQSGPFAAPVTLPLKNWHGELVLPQSQRDLEFRLRKLALSVFDLYFKVNRQGFGVEMPRFRFTGDRDGFPPFHFE